MKKFRQRVLGAITSCDTDDFDMAHAEHCAQTVQDIGEEALKLGLPDAYRRCCVGDVLGVKAAKAILGEVLAEIDRTQQPEEKPTEGPYSVKEAAKLLRISQRKLYQDIEAGLIEHQQHPIRISAAALEDYNRQRQKRSVKPGSFRNLR